MGMIDSLVTVICYYDSMLSLIMDTIKMLSLHVLLYLEGMVGKKESPKKCRINK